MYMIFVGLNNAGNYNEYHICNDIWSKLFLLLSIIDTMLFPETQ